MHAFFVLLGLFYHYSLRSDMVGVSLALAHCREEEVNTVVSPRDTRTPLHLAAALGHLAIAQILIWVTNKI